MKALKNCKGLSFTSLSSPSFSKESVSTFPSESWPTKCALSSSLSSPSLSLADINAAALPLVLDLNDAAPIAEYFEKFFTEIFFPSKLWDCAGFVTAPVPVPVVGTGFGPVVGTGFGPVVGTGFGPVVSPVFVPLPVPVVPPPLVVPFPKPAKNAIRTASSESFEQETSPNTAHAASAPAAIKIAIFFIKASKLLPCNIQSAYSLHFN